MMLDELRFHLTGDGIRAGFCGCGEYVGPHHVCPPVVRRCIVCERPAEKFDIGDGPWCSDLCKRYGKCPSCGLPPSDAEGHWCESGAGTVWRRWEQ